MLLDALLGEKKGFGGHTEGGLKQGGGGLRMEGAKAMQKLGGAFLDGIPRGQRGGQIPWERRGVSEECLGEIGGVGGFLGGIEGEPVDAREDGGASEGFLGLPLKREGEGVEEGGIDGTAFEAEVVEQVESDAGAHGREFFGGGLVFVIVAGAAVDLADPCGFEVTEEEGEHSDFEIPARMEGQLKGEGGAEGAFSGEGVAEGVEEVEEGEMASDVRECVEEGGEEEAADASVESVGGAAVVHFGEVEPEGGFIEREAEPREGGALEGEDIAVLEGEEARGVVGAQPTEGGPDVETFTGGELGAGDSGGVGK
jgi:hypothetical protein